MFTDFFQVFKSASSGLEFIKTTPYYFRNKPSAQWSYWNDILPFKTKGFSFSALIHRKISQLQVYQISISLWNYQRNLPNWICNQLRLHPRKSTSIYVLCRTIKINKCVHVHLEKKKKKALWPGFIIGINRRPFCTKEKYFLNIWCWTHLPSTLSNLKLELFVMQLSWYVSLAFHRILSTSLIFNHQTFMTP